MAMAIMAMRPLTMLIENSGDETELPSTWTDAPKSDYIIIMPGPGIVLFPLRILGQPRRDCFVASLLAMTKG
jgi:hypothetical protein